MRILLIMTISLLSITKCFSQRLIIDKLIISEIKVENNPSIINEGDGNGPHIRVLFTIQNDTEENIFLNTDFANIKACFRYREKEYNEDMIWQSFEENTKLKLAPNTSVKFSTSTYIFLGTNLWKEKKEDYTLELLEILPTLTIKYRDSNLELIGATIKDVVIKL